MMSDAQPERGASTESDDTSSVATPPAKTSHTKPKQRVAPGKPKRKQLPPFKVILHNDDSNDMLHVVRTIVDLTPLARTEALQRMWEAHRSGAAMLLVTHRERAELYVEQFTSCSLTVTAEPDA